MVIFAVADTAAAQEAGECARDLEERTIQWGTSSRVKIPCVRKEGTWNMSDRENSPMAALAQGFYPQVLGRGRLPVLYQVKQHRPSSTDSLH